MRVNLLEEKKQSSAINWGETIFIISLLIFIAVLGLNYYFLYNGQKSLKTEVNRLDRQLVKLSISLNEYHSLEKRVKELEEIEAKMAALRYVWNDIIREQGYLIPQKTMLETMEIEGDILQLFGRAENNLRVLELINNMKLSPFFKGVKLLNLRENNDVEFRIQALVNRESDQRAEQFKP